MNSKVNRLAGRQKELRDRMKKTIDRYEAVFGKPLSVKVLKDFLHEEKKEEFKVFMRDRMGTLSGSDITFLLAVLDEKQVAPELPAATVDELDELITVDPIEQGDSEE